MYSIRFTEAANFHAIARELKSLIEESRFTVKEVSLTTYEPGKYKARLSKNKFYHALITVDTIRLKRSKEYCGNHAGPCLLQRPDNHRRTNYLEGADWVEFNDMINDLLDEWEAEAVVESAAVRIRLDDRRRVIYTDKGRGEWDKYGEDTDYQNCMQECEPFVADFPSGTPGVYSSIDYNVVG